MSENKNKINLWLTILILLFLLVVSLFDIPKLSIRLTYLFITCFFALALLNKEYFTSLEIFGLKIKLREQIEKAENLILAMEDLIKEHYSKSLEEYVFLIYYKRTGDITPQFLPVLELRKQIQSKINEILKDSDKYNFKKKTYLNLEQKLYETALKTIKIFITHHIDDSMTTSRLNNILEPINDSKQILKELEKYKLGIELERDKKLVDEYIELFKYLLKKSGQE